VRVVSNVHIFLHFFKSVGEKRTRSALAGVTVAVRRACRISGSLIRDVAFIIRVFAGSGDAAAQAVEAN
jgi:hypothetical protein